MPLTSQDRQPIRVDYVLVAVNDVEHEAAKAVFGLKKHVPDPGLEFHWGVVEHDSSPFSRTVALVSLYDRSGGKGSGRLTHNIIKILAPSYVLILGIAGGFSKIAEPLKLADVVIPRLIHTGPAKGIVPRLEPIHQPSALLYKRADAIRRARSWQRYIRDRKSSQPVDSTPEAHSGGELFSSDNLVHGIDLPLAKQILHMFPRLCAAEMEAHGVADYLHDAIDTSSDARAPEYLVIKGISDLVYDEKKQRMPRHQILDQLANVPEVGSLDPNLHEELIEYLAITWAKPAKGGKGRSQKERDKSKKAAARASAAFAKELVKTFDTQPRTPTPYIRLWKPDTHKNLHPFGGTVSTIPSVDPELYSDLAREMLDRMIGQFDGAMHFFSVCAFSPARLYNMIYERFEEKHKTEPHGERLVTWAKEKFSHFAKFSEHAKKLPKPTRRHVSCARILLLDGSGDFPDKATSEESWLLFDKLNGDVPCWLVNRSELDSIHFLTDYAILGEEILLDYYEEAQVLQVGDLKGTDGRQYFLKLFNHFAEHRGEDNGPYTFLNNKKRAEILQMIRERQTTKPQ
jgi:nucleoside phosphorylase